MSYTPRTDHQEAIDNGDTKPLLNAMRQLERELNAAKAENAAMRARLETSRGRNLNRTTRPTTKKSPGNITPMKTSSLVSCPLHRKTPFIIENVSQTQLSIARHYGGIKYNGDSYTYDPSQDQLIRNDYLKWERKTSKALTK